MLVCVMLINFTASMGTYFVRKFNKETFSSTCTPLITVCAESGIVTENMRRWVANQFVKSLNVLEVEDQNYAPTCAFHLEP